MLIEQFLVSFVIIAIFYSETFYTFMIKISSDKTK